MEKRIREFIAHNMTIIKRTVDVKKERKREPEFGTPAYHEWLKIYYLGMHTAYSEMLDVVDYGKRRR